MKKMIFLAASAAFFVSGVRAADVVPNHIRHPLHTAAVKMLAPKSVVRMGATAAAASSSSTYAPTLAPGGLSSTNIIAGLSWSALLGDTATYADNSVQQEDIGSTVAGLDSNLNVTANVHSDKLTLTTGSSPLVTLGRFPILNTLAGNSDPFESPDTLYIGGQPTEGWDPVTGAYLNSIPRPGSLVVAGTPWGPFNAGALESVLFSYGVNDRNGICTKDWRDGAGSICVGDGVGQYIGVINAPALMVPPVARFTATSVTFKAPLTADQMARLRVGMYINTNIVNSTRVPNAYNGNTWGASGTPQSNFYLGVISGWSKDGTTVNVSAWDIPQASDHPSGQIPGQVTGDATDTFFSNYGYPVVFIGNPNNGSARNEYLAYDGKRAGDDSTGATTAVTGGTATAHALTADEIDLRYWATRKNEVHLDGITVSVAGSQGTPMGREALTQDSFLLALSGDIHNLLKLDGPTDGNVITGRSFFVGGGQGSDSTRSIYEMSDIGAFPDDQGNSLMRLTTFMTKESATVGPDGNAVHVGIINGGSTGDGMPSGLAAWGQLVFNRGGANNGGVSLCGGAGANAGSDASCLDVDYNGNVTMQNVVVRSVQAAGNFTLSPSAALIGLSTLGGASAWPTLKGYDATTWQFGTSANGLANLTGIYSLTMEGQLSAGAITGSTLKTSGNITLSPTAALIGLSASGGGSAYPTLAGFDATTWKFGTSAGGNASLGGIYNLTATGAVTASGSLVIPFGTPASSTASCTQGQMEMDASYIYSCVATNTWHRTSNGATW